ncbi:hypothetical protein F0344_05155 [Streptomyces finlayi]|uniref:Uncharacterized protein n=1 Tax=Streptomyces finlayi TaxID=67296 RepID=A0A7G7BFF8_9ACTN|nr:hypothetical protein [Streptomyces finlayi]QNE74073.1 hypothetical protein F0344_05155 [Streptomyces finlayi]
MRLLRGARLATGTAGPCRVRTVGHGARRRAVGPPAAVTEQGKGGPEVAAADSVAAA